MLPSQRSDESGADVAVGVAGIFGMSMAYAAEAAVVGLSWRVDQAENL
jgi:glycine cleavage system pyridoxal-binding protein P